MLLIFTNHVVILSIQDVINIEDYRNIFNDSCQIAYMEKVFREKNFVDFSNNVKLSMNERSHLGM